MALVRLAVPATLAVLVVAGSAAAKDIRPGDLRICNGAKCVAIFDRVALKRFGAFYYGAGTVATAPAPARGAPAFRLKLGTSIVGVAATRRLDRVLVYGLNCGRFERGVWYRLPRRAASALRRVTVGLVPQRVRGAFRVPASRRFWRNTVCAAGPRCPPPGGVLSRANSFPLLTAPCVLAWERASHPGGER